MWFVPCHITFIVGKVVKKKKSAKTYGEDVVCTMSYITFIVGKVFKKKISAQTYGEDVVCTMSYHF
jgi:hypothetical protein